MSDRIPQIGRWRIHITAEWAAVSQHDSPELYDMNVSWLVRPWRSLQRCTELAVRRAAKYAEQDAQAEALRASALEYAHVLSDLGQPWTAR